MEQNNNKVTQELANKSGLDDLSSVIGLVREMGPFKAMVLDDMSIAIRTETGWMVVYPPINDTWALMIAMMIGWEEEDRHALEMYIKLVVYPSSNVLAIADNEFFSKIADTFDELFKRKHENDEGNENDSTDL